MTLIPAAVVPPPLTIEVELVRSAFDHEIGAYSHRRLHLVVDDASAQEIAAAIREWNMEVPNAALTAVANAFHAMGGRR